MPILDDNDMHAILTCIDAKHTLKKLKLAGDVHELMVDAVCATFGRIFCAGAD